MMGLPITMFSMFGLVTLAGVVVNDSIVMVDFINARRRDGATIQEALLSAGRRRMRPVLLTSITTVGGLFPLILERSFQAQVLIPMAVSLCFGLCGATLIVLYLVPVLYSLYARFVLRELSAGEYFAAPSAARADVALEPRESEPRESGPRESGPRESEPEFVAR